MTTPPPASQPPAPPPKGRPPQVGTTFGHYRVDAVIGVGGMGMVYSATDLRLNRQVALKVVLGHYAESVEFTQRFQHEAAMLARLDSPHVIKIYDHGQHEGWPYLVTQYAGGGDLAKLLRQRGALAPRLAAKLCGQIADGLMAAHAVGVVHRDVKPPNVLLRDDRLDRLHVYLCDFGVAHTESTGLTTPGSVAGTWNYLAPERAQGEPGTPASDVYSVGCLLWETLTGRPPYTGPDVEVAMAHLQSPVPQLPGQDEFTIRTNQILARCLAKDPAHRYASAAELREQLRILSGGLTSPTPSSSPLTIPYAPRSRRKMALAGVAGAGLVAAVAIAAIALWPAGGSPTPEPTPTPTSGGTEQPAPAPAPPMGAASGDLTGDGRGDLAVLDYDLSSLYYSTGSAFREEAIERTDITTPAFSGDINGDGRMDIVTISGDGRAVGVIVHNALGGERTTLMNAPPSTEPTRIPMSGDFNNDGRDDVAVASFVSGELVLTTALSQEESTLGESREWYRGDLGGTDTFTIGDFDGDGADDIMQLVNGETLSGRLLRSTGDSFEDAATLDLGDDYYSATGWQAGDFDGDGAAELAYADTPTNVVVFEYVDGEFTSPKPWAISEKYDYFEAISASDVDGDGLDDLVFVSEGKVSVLRSSGSDFNRQKQWTFTTGEDYVGDVLDRVSGAGFS